MTREEIYLKVSSLLSELFEIPEEEISLESNLYEDLDLDSIDAVDLVVHIKNFTEKDIEPAEFKQVRTVKDVVDVISKLV